MELSFSINMDCAGLKDLIEMIEELTEIGHNCINILDQAGYEGDADELRDAITNLQEYLTGEIDGRPDRTH